MAKNDERQDATATPASVEPFSYDDFQEAVISVKGCAAALTSLYVNDAGRLTYDLELFEVLARQLHGAAQTFDALTPALESL